MAITRNKMFKKIVVSLLKSPTNYTFVWYCISGL